MFLYCFFSIVTCLFIFSFCFFFLMIRRPPRSTQGVSSAASDVYKRQCITVDQAYRFAGHPGLYGKLLYLPIITFAANYDFFLVSFSSFLSLPKIYGCGPDYSSLCSTTAQACSSNNRYYADKNENLISEFDLVCDEYKAALLPFIIAFMGAVTVFLLGNLSDNCGRVRIMILSSIISLVSLIISVSIPNYYVNLVCYGAYGIGLGSFFISIIFCYDSIPRYDAISYTRIYSIGGSFSVMLAGLLYYFKLRWRIVSIVAMGIQILAALSLAFMKESARYLLVKGRIDEAIHNLQEIARINEVEYQNYIIKDQNVVEQQALNCRSLWRIMLQFWVLWRVLFVCFLHCCLGLEYYGIFINMSPCTLR
eukprot:TRINITY_DN1191_c0_g1_i3.p1 TRINITY_DN1191_c0_g1~~TRINITY_DN1191_c0_g1_i3.p1  ORF type:complete len:365 (-),score=26.12 TRINITY_DN1191_c0_g1_i3:143-1237(-)